MQRRSPLRTRASGVLLHVTSLPGSAGSGDMGDEAYAFVDWLHRARQGLWQVLPLVPPGYGESPYQGYSAFAGNPLLLSLERLQQEPWFSTDPGSRSTFPADDCVDFRVDFQTVIPYRQEALREAFAQFQKQASSPERERIDAFREANRWWLEDYALFMSLKEYYGGVVWNNWPLPLAHRKAEALEEARRQLQEAIDSQVFFQYQFSHQWHALKQYANARGIRIIGDIPIFVAHDSADVWANQDQFFLDVNGNPRVIAGVPPDYFSATGQRWGNPLYRWDVMRETGYAWWIKRLSYSAKLFDYIRLDHFRGFEAYWEIPADSPDAVTGRWAPGPGAEFFQAAQQKLGPLPLIAEDLGVITPPVQALRDQFGFPGMRVIQFGFGDDPLKTLHQPHNFVRNCVAYSGTHDNDTTVGWLNSVAGKDTTRTEEQVQRERREILQYLGGKSREIHWQIIRLVLSSVARFAVVTMQDILGLGTEARMNLPGTSRGNWCWRMQPGQLLDQHAERLSRMSQSYGRKMLPGKDPRQVIQFAD
ncbi:MAG: 4-alpha-glucanotransferase [Planctomycetales bacterium]